MVSIKGLDRAAVLAALYNAFRPQGMGFLHYDPTPMTVEEARELLGPTGGGNFDYLKGRVMKLRFDPAKEELEPGLYDRDNGQGAAERVINALRESGNPNAEPIKTAHNQNTLAAAAVEDQLDTPTTISGGTVKMGLSDVKHVLGPAVKKVVGDRN